jgi:hypothetical protein
MRVTGIRNLGYVYTVSAATKAEAAELAKREYRNETGDLTLKVEEVKIAAKKKKKKAAF